VPARDDADEQHDRRRVRERDDRQQHLRGDAQLLGALRETIRVHHGQDDEQHGLDRRGDVGRVDDETVGQRELEGDHYAQGERDHQRRSPSVVRSQAGGRSAVPNARARAPADWSAMIRIVRGGAAVVFAARGR